MLMVCTNDGKLYFLSLAMGVDLFGADDWTLRLFANDYTPEDASVTADFTEASFTGYVEWGIPAGSMPAPTIVADVAESDLTPPPFFTCTGGAPETVYGWYLTADGSGDTLLAQRFEDPREMVPGAVESLDPFKIKLKTFS